MTSLPGSRTKGVIRAAGASNETRFRSLGSASASSSNRARSSRRLRIAASVASATEGACLATFSSPLAGSKSFANASPGSSNRHGASASAAAARGAERASPAPRTRVIFELTSSNASRRAPTASRRVTPANANLTTGALASAGSNTSDFVSRRTRPRALPRHHVRAPASSAGAAGGGAVIEPATSRT